MADQYYAWSNFPIEVSEWGKVEKMVKVGQKVTKEDLKADDDTWAEYIELGVVRTDAYPDISPQSSPAEYFGRLEAAVLNGTATEDEVKEYEKIRPTYVETAESEAATAEAEAAGLGESKPPAKK